MLVGYFFFDRFFNPKVCGFVAGYSPRGFVIDDEFAIEIAWPVRVCLEEGVCFGGVGVDDDFEAGPDCRLISGESGRKE